ncbi:ABC transporter permease [Adhaeribacter radiodurans]|uniref:ABC transporter permease n=1 Tax=Adhaeribacter radiodurans TaxID=2745197 RepID=A0A7L7LEM4_9BACT|nr:ABC transporter permease [Adhaeribacter radiodurans]QMU31207.1 ABC transporter permease [Adhaeribacter radiodurans]
MITHYLKLAFRNLFRHKFYSFLNIAGLAIGMACCLLIFLYVRTSLGYDTHHQHANDIYRIVAEDKNVEREKLLAFTTPMLAPTLLKNLPEVEQAARLIIMPGSLVEYEQNRFYEDNFYLADSSILQILNLRLRYGDARTALHTPNSVLLSEATAQKYFGSENPVGKTISLDKEAKLTVTGVLAKPTTPTHLKADFIASFSLARSLFQERLQDWTWQQFYTYIRLKNNTSRQEFEAKLADFTQKVVDPLTRSENTQYVFHLQPVKHIYLRSAHLEYDQPNRGNINYVYAFAIIAVFILVIACFNFMNLSTARSLKRAKEVGVRKVIGAQKSQLIGQYLGESILMTLLAFVLAIPLVKLVLPFFNALSGEFLHLHFSKDLPVIVGLLVLSIPVGVLAGLYPAFFLSSFRPITVLKSNTTANGYRLSSLRQGLVVIQFVISVVLIAATAIVYRQLNYLQNKDLGFNKEQTLVFRMEGTRMQQAYEQFKTELLRNPNVLAATASYGEPGGVAAGETIRLRGDKNDRYINMFAVDYDYLPVLNMQMVAGRPFSRKFKTDEKQGFILNETAVKEFNLGTPEQVIGKEIFWDEWEAPNQVKNGKVVGVVKDFHFKTIQQKIEPLVMHVYPAAFTWMTVRIRPTNISATLADLEKTWRTMAPEYPFTYHFLDESFGKMIAKEHKMSQVFTIFSGLAIFIACLGLLGLVAFAAQQRTKEIGIRKVLGASVPQIMLLLSRDFTKLILIAIVIACPIAWYGMNKWLQNFAYRIDINWWVFGLAGMGALLIALLTVSFQAIKAAVANPVNALRSE